VKLPKILASWMMKVAASHDQGNGRRIVHSRKMDARQVSLEVRIWRDGRILEKRLTEEIFCIKKKIKAHGVRATVHGKSGGPRGKSLLSQARLQRGPTCAAGEATFRLQDASLIIISISETALGN
jgi:hypothetical protein